MAPILQGIVIHPKNPLNFDFIVNKGSTHLSDQALQEKAQGLIKYFLAGLTLPEEDLWVNLSPAEKNRILPQTLGQTEMGKGLLSQDYLLKQLTASLMYPEGEIGKKFWQEIYRRAQEKFGTTHIPVNTLQRVWIVPDVARIFENKDRAVIVKSRLKVMLEEDLTMAGDGKEGSRPTIGGRDTAAAGPAIFESSQVIREIIVPEIEREVNEGEQFVLLRQIYHSVILATWFKKNLKKSLLGETYVDKAKVKGVETDDPEMKEKIYQQYLDAFKKGAYNYIREEVDPSSGQMIPRKYFSGGTDLKVTVDSGATAGEAEEILRDPDGFVQAESRFKTAWWNSETEVDQNFLRHAWPPSKTRWISAEKIEAEELDSESSAVSLVYSFLENLNVLGAAEARRIFEQLLLGRLEGRASSGSPQINRIIVREYDGEIPVKGHASDRGIHIFVDARPGKPKLSARQEAGILLHELVAFLGGNHAHALSVETVFRQWVALKRDDQLSVRQLVQPLSPNLIDAFQRIRRRIESAGNTRPPDLLTILSRERQGKRDYAQDGRASPLIGDWQEFLEVRLAAAETHAQAAHRASPQVPIPWLAWKNLEEDLVCLIEPKNFSLGPDGNIVLPSPSRHIPSHPGDSADYRAIIQSLNALWQQRGWGSIYPYLAMTDDRFMEVNLSRAAQGRVLGLIQGRSYQERAAFLISRGMRIMMHLHRVGIHPEENYEEQDVYFIDQEDLSNIIHELIPLILEWRENLPDEWTQAAFPGLLEAEGLTQGDLMLWFLVVILQPMVHNETITNLVPGNFKVLMGQFREKFQRQQPVDAPSVPIDAPEDLIAYFIDQMLQNLRAQDGAPISDQSVVNLLNEAFGVLNKPAVKNTLRFPGNVFSEEYTYSSTVTTVLEAISRPVGVEPLLIPVLNAEVILPYVEAVRRDEINALLFAEAVGKAPRAKYLTDPEEIQLGLYAATFRHPRLVGRFGAVAERIESTINPRPRDDDEAMLVEAGGAPSRSLVGMLDLSETSIEELQMATEVLEGIAGFVRELKQHTAEQMPVGLGEDFQKLRGQGIVSAQMLQQSSLVAEWLDKAETEGQEVELQDNFWSLYEAMSDENEKVRREATRRWTDKLRGASAESFDLLQRFERHLRTGLSGEEWLKSRAARAIAIMIDQNRVTRQMIEILEIRKAVDVL
ncbi:MAG: hypothetical protein NUV91_00840, partial [Candidatus Omnitrophica bacterium]|nr:hypothetical protein [Candidatus Omnitrophota bacterium]